MTAPYIPLPVVESRPDPGPFSGVLFDAYGIKLTVDGAGCLLYVNGAMNRVTFDVARRFGEAILAAIPEGEDAHA